MIPLEWSDEGRTQLFVAYAKAQAEMGEVYKRVNNTFFNSQYADLSAVLDAVRPAFSSNGLAIIQSPSFDGEVVSVETIITHIGGGWLRSVLSMKPMKADPQGIGSATTYAKRYAILSLAGVAPEGEDDDGNAASANGSKPEPGKRFTKELERPEEGQPVARKSSAQAKKDGDWDVILKELAEQRTLDELLAWAKSRSKMIKALPRKWFDEVEIKYLDRKNELAAAEDNRSQTEPSAQTAANGAGGDRASRASAPSMETDDGTLPIGDDTGASEMDEAFANTVGPGDFPGDRPRR